MWLLFSDRWKPSRNSLPLWNYCFRRNENKVINYYYYLSSYFVDEWRSLLISDDYDWSLLISSTNRTQLIVLNLDPYPVGLGSGSYHVHWSSLCYSRGFRGRSVYHCVLPETPTTMIAHASFDFCELPSGWFGRLTNLNNMRWPLTFGPPPTPMTVQHGPRQTEN